MSKNKPQQQTSDVVGPNAGLRRLQMSDIARLAGVSTATVSRALNDSPLVTAETRARVKELARSLNYTINVGAKNLRLRRNKTVAVVVPYDSASRQSVSDPFFLSMLGSLADALTEHGYDMLLSRVDARQLDAAAQFIDTGRAMGVILIGQWRHHDQLNQMAARNLPIVIWGALLPQQLYCTIGCDNIAGGALATEHLVACGRRQIAFLGDTKLPEVHLRLEGYQRALARNNIRFNKRLCVSAPFLAEGARNAIRELQQRNIEFDAVFACSDLLAMTVVSTLQKAGRRVPEDVAVVGYDDIEMASHAHPPLTTVRQPIEAGGRALVAALLEFLEGGRPQPKTLATELIVRQSTPPVLSDNHDFTGARLAQ